MKSMRFGIVNKFSNALIIMTFMLGTVSLSLAHESPEQVKLTLNRPLEFVIESKIVTVKLSPLKEGAQAARSELVWSPLFQYQAVSGDFSKQTGGQFPGSKEVCTLGLADIKGKEEAGLRATCVINPKKVFFSLVTEFVDQQDGQNITFVKYKSGEKEFGSCGKAKLVLSCYNILSSRERTVADAMNAHVGVGSNDFANFIELRQKVEDIRSRYKQVGEF